MCNDVLLMMMMIKILWMRMLVFKRNHFLCLGFLALSRTIHFCRGNILSPSLIVIATSSMSSLSSSASPTASDIQRFHVGKRYSEASVFNGVAYLAGMVPECAETDIRSQTADVLKQVQERLLETNSDKSRILRAQIYLRDISDISAMNEVWDAWVVPGTAPPRATVQAALADPSWRIEIVVTAAVQQ